MADVLDGEWIKARLTGKRGEKARLAEALGIQVEKVSKILSGERQVQPNEVLPLLRFFNETLGEDETIPLIDLIRQNAEYLTDADREAVAALIRALAAKSRGAPS